MGDSRHEPRPDDDSPASSDERDLGWGGRDWDSGEGNDGGNDDADLQRLIADRPPHHEERER